MGCGSSRPVGAPVGMGALRVDVERPRGPAAPFKVVVMGDKGIGKSRRVLLPPLPLQARPIFCRAVLVPGSALAPSPLSATTSFLSPRFSPRRDAPSQRGRALYQRRLCRQHDGDHWRRLCHEGRARGRRLAGAAADLGCVADEAAKADADADADADAAPLAASRAALPARARARARAYNPAPLPPTQTPPARRFTAR